MIHACEHHDAVLHDWRRRERTGLALCHVDFHDDLRGLMIDRRHGTAYAIGALARGQAPLDAGNFLAHAVLEGRVDRVRWVHGVPGGRAFDAGIVRYSSDLLALPRRLGHALGGGPESKLVFEELRLEDWNGLAPGECLSVDWDCFASVLDDPSGIQRRVARFLERLGPRVPAESHVVYSPEYSHPSLEAFRGLIDELSRRFGQPVVWLSPGLATGRLDPRDVDPRPPRDWSMRAILFFRRHGIY